MKTPHNEWFCYHPHILLVKRIFLQVEERTVRFETSPIVLFQCRRFYFYFLSLFKVLIIVMSYVTSPNSLDISAILLGGASTVVMIRVSPCLNMFMASSHVHYLTLKTQVVILAIVITFKIYPRYYTIQHWRMKYSIIYTYHFFGYTSYFNNNSKTNFNCVDITTNLVK